MLGCRLLLDVALGAKASIVLMKQDAIIEATVIIPETATAPLLPSKISCNGSAIKMERLPPARSGITFTMPNIPSDPRL